MREINRLDFEHLLLRQALGGLYAARIGQPLAILDVGSGMGRWALEMAGLFPDANVIGFDAPDTLALASAPEAPPPPENCTFVSGNLLDRLPFADETFDYVHMRLQYLSIPTARWPGVVGELVRITRAGGQVELVETAPPQRTGPALAAIIGWFAELANTHGIDIQQGARVGELLRDAGLTDGALHTVTLPVGEHGERIGTMLAANNLAYIVGFGELLRDTGTVSRDQLDQALAAARDELENGECLQSFFVAHGHRPDTRSQPGEFNSH